MYCNRENLITNIPDTNEVHLLFIFLVIYEETN